MQKTNIAVAILRIVLVVAFLLLLFFQTLSIPGQFSDFAERNPNSADLRWPLTAFGIAVLLCVQVVIVATWKLLSMVKTGRIFSPAAMKWVDAIIWSVAAAWLMVFVVFLFVGFNADDPALPLLMFLIVVGGAVLGLLLVVMRTLLHQATTLRTDMDAVI